MALIVCAEAQKGLDLASTVMVRGLCPLYLIIRSQIINLHIQITQFFAQGLNPSSQC